MRLDPRILARLQRKIVSLVDMSPLPIFASRERFARDSALREQRVHCRVGVKRTNACCDCVFAAFAHAAPRMICELGMERAPTSRAHPICRRGPRRSAAPCHPPYTHSSRTVRPVRDGVHRRTWCLPSGHKCVPFPVLPLNHRPYTYSESDFYKLNRSEPFERFARALRWKHYH